MASYQHVLYVEFIKESLLRQYVISKLSNVPKVFPFNELICVIQNLIFNEKLYDPQNPAIIMCDSLLEFVLNKKTIYFRDLPLVLTQHVIPLFTQLVLQNCVTPVHNQFKNHVTIPFQVNNTALINITPKTHERFKISSQLRSVLSQAAGFDVNETVFSFEYLHHFLWQYLLLKFATFVDPRDPSIYVIDNDPLSYIFKVKAFHCCQINFLLTKQLIPVRRSLRIYNFNNKL